HAVRYGLDPGIVSRGYAAQALWALGYPAQARQCMEEGLRLAQELPHRFSQAAAAVYAAMQHQLRRVVPTTQGRAEAVIGLATAQGFPHWLAHGTLFRGWALAAQGHAEEGMAQVREGIAAWQATGAALLVPYSYTLLAEVSAHLGHTEDGLQVLA